MEVNHQCVQQPCSCRSSMYMRRGTIQVKNMAVEVEMPKLGKFLPWDFRSCCDKNTTNSHMPRQSGGSDIKDATL